MNVTVPAGLDALLPDLASLLTRHTGLRFDGERRADLERGLRASARELGFDNAVDLGLRLLAAPLTKRHIGILANHLTVGETYFFRDRSAFGMLSGHVLPELIRQRRDGRRLLRIWSAGCASGEEIYSIAILLDQLISDMDGWCITLLATDISSESLRKAQDGVYGEWSFRESMPAARERYFQRTAEGHHRLTERCRKGVTFRWLNLIDDDYPSTANDTADLDIVLCRNVLMYLGAPQREHVIRKLGASLADGGWLMVGPSDAPQGTLPGFATVSYPGGVLFRKNADSTPLSVPEWSPAACRHADAGALPDSIAAVILNPSEAGSVDALSGTGDWSGPAVAGSGTAIDTNGAGADSEPVPPSRIADGAMNRHEHAIAHAPAVAEMAQACANEGRLDEAADLCAQAIAIDKMNPAYCFLFASVREEQGLIGEAIRLLQRTLYLDPDFVRAHLALGSLSLRQGRPGDSRRHFATALALLRGYGRDDPVPGSGGLPAGSLIELLLNMNATADGHRDD